MITYSTLQIIVAVVGLLVTFGSVIVWNIRLESSVKANRRETEHLWTAMEKHDTAREAMELKLEKRINEAADKTNTRLDKVDDTLQRLIFKLGDIHNERE